ncbi:MAG: hypothetical protein E4H41_09140, partial [Gemmatimonadales bacterium]
MTDDARRRLGAVTALVLGLFAGLTLLPISLTGPLGHVLGGFLWAWLGIGALGVPLLGLGLGLAGFDRLPRLDMKRAAILAAGLSIVVPYVVGVISRVTPEDLVPDVAGRALGARMTGLAPGFLASGVDGIVGFAGALLLGFLALSALTLLTIAWHPLQRLERQPESEEAKAAAPPRRMAPLPPIEDDEEEDEAPAKGTAPRKGREPKPTKGKPLAPAPVPDVESELPPMELLQEPPIRDIDAGEAQLDRLGQVLLDTLRTFKVDGTIAGRTTGPVVTQFEIVPAPGVKVGRIAALADDLALAMHAPSIRIVAPIPGKGAVGIEVPNPTARMVTIRELIAAPEWERSRATLPIALGRDLEGRPVVADLGKMPHLLIAGATGSGKSVAINTIITSLVYRYTPHDLRMLMIDPKMVELSMYNSLPHLRHKVVTNNHEAATALKWAVHEMNRRYELLHANSARNLADFNRKVADGKPLRNPARPKLTLTSVNEEPADTPPPPPEEDVYTEGHLPFIVLFVDELADLMMTVQGEVEAPLAMLAQKARAIGIHLILATQRPSVNVITGLIKANFPSRIAFRVASKVDSRTILDQNGAEALLGNGDMLFLPPGKSEPLRLQGAFISTEESERVMEWYVKRREARQAAAKESAEAESDILETVRALEAAAAGGGGADGGDGSERDSL